MTTALKNRTGDPQQHSRNPKHIPECRLRLEFLTHIVFFDHFLGLVYPGKWRMAPK